MNDRFDELARSLAGGLTRREALRKTGGLLAAALLAALGLSRPAEGAVVVGGTQQGSLHRLAGSGCPPGTKQCPSGACVPSNYSCTGGGIGGSSCSRNSECPPGYRCRSGRCVPR